MPYTDTIVTMEERDQPLRPMATAPKDCRDWTKILGYTKELEGLTAHILWRNENLGRWAHSDGTIDEKWLVGWLPLPNAKDPVESEKPPTP